MLMQECFPVLDGWSVRIVASDFSGRALAHALQGRYNRVEIQRGLPVELRDKYFYPQGNEWQICDELRQKVEFYQINLVQLSSTLDAAASVRCDFLAQRSNLLRD